MAETKDQWARCSKHAYSRLPRQTPYGAFRGDIGLMVDGWGFMLFNGQIPAIAFIAGVKVMLN
eukprot:scaffold19446_cov22-Prasinocladus_malaysianus.AAC.1